VLVSDVEVIGLRPVCRRTLSESSLSFGFATPHLVMVIADADNFRDLSQLLTDIRHDRGPELNGPGFPGDMGRVCFGDQPVIAAIGPDIEAAGADQLDCSGGDIVWQRPLLDDR